VTIREAERAVVVARRRKRKALPGTKLRRQFELEQAVTAALKAARLSNERGDSEKIND
jgi:hypothetical protein